MPLQWEEWKLQTTAYFDALGEGLLPVGTKSHLNVRTKCFFVANSPWHQFFGELVKQNGAMLGPSFNTDYDKNLPRAKGSLLLIETHGGVPIVDVAILRKHFPVVASGKQKSTLKDGDTTIVFVEVDAFAEQITDAFTLQSPTPKAATGAHLK